MYYRCVTADLLEQCYIEDNQEGYDGYSDTRGKRRVESKVE